MSAEALPGKTHQAWWLSRRFLSVLTHFIVLIPLILIIYDFYTDQLTANPIQDITLRTGKTALILLVLSLLNTPMRRALRLPLLVPWRKWLGLWAFFYASCHLFIYVGLDYFFDLELLWLEISEKLYVIAGFSAWLMMLPLALTSTKGWQRRLGKRWKLLHRLAYAAGLVAASHYTWLVKSDIREPLIYGAIVMLLLIFRLPPVAQRLPRRAPAA
ncbi:protein-methionine-sulfoxide reductase heme-binding subunit MsrQ [Candidatus Neomarinimicrobiota bacterium]